MNKLAERKMVSLIQKYKSYFFFFFYKSNKYDKPLTKAIKKKVTNIEQQSKGDITTMDFFFFLITRGKVVKTRGMFLDVTNIDFRSERPE